MACCVIADYTDWLCKKQVDILQGIGSSFSVSNYTILRKISKLFVCETPQKPEVTPI